MTVLRQIDRAEIVSYLAIVNTYLNYVRICSRDAARSTRRSRFNASRRYRKARSKCTCRWPRCVYKSLENQAQHVRVQEEKYKHYCPTGDTSALKDSTHSHKRGTCESVNGEEYAKSLLRRNVLHHSHIFMKFQRV